jgi:predicted MFS family arabinose efflux permease
LKRSLGTAGSFLGGIVAMMAMMWTSNDFRQVFWLATIPATISIVILVLFVKEPKHHEHPQKLDPNEPVKPTRQPIQLSDLPKLGKNYWMLMVVIFMFMLARFSETLLMLHANQNYGLSETYVPVIMMLYNATYCLSSYPIASMSDRMNRYVFLAFGIIVLILSDIVLFTAPNLYVMMIGVALWGLQIGVVQSVSVALVIDIVPTHLRGTALGFYYLISAIAAVFAGWGAGSIAEFYGEGSAFFASAIMALLSVLILLAFMPTSKRKKKKRAQAH